MPDAYPLRPRHRFDLTSPSPHPGDAAPDGMPGAIRARAPLSVFRIAGDRSPKHRSWAISATAVRYDLRGTEFNRGLVIHVPKITRRPQNIVLY
jgi:hypothetical protein